jgi:hypothetical protein
LTDVPDELIDELVNELSPGFELFYRLSGIVASLRFP